MHAISDSSSVSDAAASTATPTTQPAVGWRSLLAPALALAGRDLKHFFRDRNRITSALVTPIGFWLLLGSGFYNSFDHAASGQSNYLAYFYAGAAGMILLFTAVFSTITIIEDRKSGFLQGVLVAPVSRLAIVAGKLAGGTTIAFIHLLIFLLFWPLAIGWPDSTLGWAMVPLGLAMLVVQAITMTAIGLIIAWPMQSTAGFHAIMMLVLMPLWFLSGAVFPADTAAGWLRVLIYLNPLTYGQAAATHWFTAGQVSTGLALPPALCALLALVIALGLVAWACRVVASPSKTGR